MGLMMSGFEPSSLPGGAGTFLGKPTKEGQILEAASYFVLFCAFDLLLPQDSLLTLGALLRTRVRDPMLWSQIVTWKSVKLS